MDQYLETFSDHLKTSPYSWSVLLLPTKSILYVHLNHQVVYSAFSEETMRNAIISEILMMMMMYFKWTKLRKMVGNKVTLDLS